MSTVLETLEKTYFKAVNLHSIPTDEKIKQIVDTFCEDSKIVDNEGVSWIGKKGVADFYRSSTSPVTKKGFIAKPVVDTACIKDGYVSVMIDLIWDEGSFRVHDFFLLQDEKIKELLIFKVK
jgi:hypothetical protein